MSQDAVVQALMPRAAPRAAMVQAGVQRVGAPQKQMFADSTFPMFFPGGYQSAPQPSFLPMSPQRQFGGGSLPGWQPRMRQSLFGF